MICYCFVLQTVHMAPQLEAENKEYCCLWLGCKVTVRHGYPRVLALHVVHYLSDKLYTRTYQQLELTVSCC